MSSRSKNPAQPPLLEEQVFVALSRAADALTLGSEQLFRPAGLSGTQYNVLRILRGAEPLGLPCRAIGERMICHDPDITRLLDRMEKRGWITRARQTDDRRVVKVHITAAGLAALKALDVPVREMHKKQFQHMSAARLRTLSDLLRELQGGLS
jgi:DNA-binding MarR family transcriptional regulator